MYVCVVIRIPMYGVPNCVYMHPCIVHMSIGGTYTMYITIITMYLTLLVCLGTYALANMGFRVALAYLHTKEQEEITFSVANMSLAIAPVVDDTMPDYMRHGLTAEEARAMDALDDEIYASIAAYEQEMDQEWEDEIMGYTFRDIAIDMALSTEDVYEDYEDLPFTASMRRSAKTNKRINFVLNCGEERSVHHANAKDHK